MYCNLLSHNIDRYNWFSFSIVSLFLFQLSNVKSNYEFIYILCLYGYDFYYSAIKPVWFILSNRTNFVNLFHVTGAGQAVVWRGLALNQVWKCKMGPGPEREEMGELPWVRTESQSASPLKFWEWPRAPRAEINQRWP